MTVSTSDRLAKVHERALTRFDAIQNALRDERMQCLQDRRFYSIAGAQWEGPLGDQFENKPRFEMNKVHLAVIRIINEYRNNRISVDFTRKDGISDDKMADTCDGLYRADEQASGAQEAYDNAFEEGVGGGYGAWRLRAEYEDEDDDENDQQRICIEPIYDADSSVFFDLDAKRQDKADAKFAFVITSKTHQAYMDDGGDNPVDWPKLIHQYEFDWCTPDVVYMAEYFEIETKTVTMQVWRGLAGDEQTYEPAEFTDDPHLEASLKARGFRKVREKRKTVRKVHKYVLSGCKVEEDEGFIAGRCIPIVPFYGKRWFVDNLERCMGHVRLAKDAQRLTNMLMSWLAEIAARFDTEKPILTPEQIQGHATMWAEDNVKKYPYLLVNAVLDAQGGPAAIGPQSYTKAPNIPPAMAALMQLAEQSLQDLLGNQQAGEEVHPNMSGKAVELIQNRLDMQAFIYLSNFAKAMKRSGEIWLSMKKDITVEESRRMKVLDENGGTGSVVVNQPAYDAEAGKEFIENDLSEATFDVNVEVGPSSSSRRTATVRALTGMLSISTDPGTRAVLESLVMMNMEGEGVSDARDYFRKKLVFGGVVKPTEDEKAELEQEQQAQAQQPPSPQDQYLLAEAEKSKAETQKTMADAQKSVAQEQQVKADAALKVAQTAKTEAETAGEHTAQRIDTADAIGRAMAPPKPAS